MNEREPDPSLPRRADCPSDLAIDQLQLGELKPAERRDLERHVAQCERCEARVQQLSLGFAALPQVDAEGMIDRLHRQLADQSMPAELAQALGGEPDRADPSQAGKKDREVEDRELVGLLDRVAQWLFPSGRFQMVTAASALLLVVGVGWFVGRSQLTDGLGQGQIVTVERHGAQRGDAVRTKGVGLRLRVFRQHPSGGEEVLTGERFSPGDRLRFKVSAPTSGHLLVVGRESSGALYAAYPIEADDSSRPLKAGIDQQLPGAIELDDSQGHEWLHAVFCEQAFSLSQLKAGATPSELRTPEGCQVQSFEMVKERR